MGAATVRIPALDGVRGLAICLVLVWHYFVNQIQLPPGSTWILPLALLRLTWSGVDLFFVLSGFLIVGILVDVRRSDTYFKTFYVRRACRILPLYYLVIGVFALNTVVPYSTNAFLFDDARPLWSYLTFTQNIPMHEDGAGANFVGVTWSLAIEEQFYLVLPLLVRFLDKRKLAVVFVAGILMAPVFRHLIGNLGAYVWPFARADGILLGGLIAIAVRHPPAIAFLRARQTTLVRICAVLILGVVPLSLFRGKIGDPLNHFWLALLYGVVVLLVVLFKDEESRAQRVFRRPSLRWLGTRSYAIYLFHQPVSGLLHAAAGRTFPWFSNAEELAVTFLALVIVFVLAEVSFRLLEAPFLRLGQRSTYEHTAT